MTSTPKKTIVLQADDSDIKDKKDQSVPTGPIDATKACENCFTLGSSWYQGKHAHLCNRCKDSTYFAPIILKTVRSRYFDRFGIDERKYNESQLRSLFPFNELLAAGKSGQIHLFPIDIKKKQNIVKGGKKPPVIYTFRSGDVDKWIDIRVLEEVERRRRQEEEDRLRKQLHQQRQQQQRRF